MQRKNEAQAKAAQAEALGAAQARVSLVRDHVVNGSYAEAIVKAEERLAEHPDDLRMSALLGAAQILSGDSSEGERTLGAALRDSARQREWVQALAELHQSRATPASVANTVDAMLHDGALKAYGPAK